jgi:hypothetical protein
MAATPTKFHHGAYVQGLNVAVTGISAGPYNVLPTDVHIKADAVGGAFQINLPATPFIGQAVDISKTDMSINHVTVSGNGNNIHGAASFLLTTQYQSVTFVWNGATWSTFGSPTYVWDDLRAPATAVNPVGPAAPATPDTVVPGLLFASGGTNVVHILLQMPHTWVEGSSVIPHLHWMPTSVDVGFVRWQLEIQALNVHEVLGAYTTTPIDSVGLGTADIHQYASFGSFGMAGKKISCMIMVKLSRLGGADTYADDARLLEFDIHYLKDGLGSVGEVTKSA